MATRVTLHSLPDGRVVVDKQSLPADDAIRKQEAEWLAMARDPGIVRLVGVTEDPFTIRTAHAGTTTLRTARPDPGTAARLLGATSETLANLHERNLAHGKLEMDHIIVAGKTHTNLCSPDGAINDPLVDLGSLGQIVAELLAGWESDGVEVTNKQEWTALVERLSEPNTSYTARRGQMAFGRLASESKTRLKQNIIGRRRISVRTLASIAGAVLIVGAVASWSSLVAANPPTAQANSSVELVIGTDLYRLDDPSYVAVALPTPCEGQPLAVVLDSNSVVWVFHAVGDRAQATSLVQVRGATNLKAVSSAGCGQVWATGPAGQSLVVGN